MDRPMAILRIQRIRFGAPLAGKSGSLGSTGHLLTRTNIFCEQVIFTHLACHALTSDRVLLIRR